jgi:hypothetical protein
VLGAPVLLGLDSSFRVRALSVPPPGSAFSRGVEGLQAAAGDDDVARAALAAVGLTTKAAAYLVGAGVGVATLGALQVNLQAQSAELDNYVKYNASYNTAVGGGQGGGGGAAAGTGQAHVALAPVPGRDALVAANASGEVFVLHPHGGEQRSGGGPGAAARGGAGGAHARAQRGRGAALALQAAAQAAVGSGISERQVEAKLSLPSLLAADGGAASAAARRALATASARAPRSDAPVAALAVAPSGRFVAVAQADSGLVVVWERIAASRAAEEDEAEAALARGGGAAGARRRSVGGGGGERR